MDKSINFNGSHNGVKSSGNACHRRMVLPYKSPKVVAIEMTNAIASAPNPNYIPEGTDGMIFS